MRKNYNKYKIKRSMITKLGSNQWTIKQINNWMTLSLKKKVRLRNRKKKQIKNLNLIWINSIPIRTSN